MANDLRYVIKNSKQLGIEETFFKTTKRKRKLSTHPYWYVYDKEMKQVVEGSRQSERQFAKNHADRLNKEAGASID